MERSGGHPSPLSCLAWRPGPARVAGFQHTMQITFKLFATLTDYLPLTARRDNQLPLELAEGTTVAQAIDQFALPPRLVHLVLVNGHYIAPEARSARVLQADDVLAIWPPIAGG